jgi:S1-C subfamily serine protease
MEILMTTKNGFSLISEALVEVVEVGAAYTVLVSARRHLPASGIIYQPDLVLTADHVIERDEDILVAAANGLKIKAKLIGRDPGSDLALLKLESALPAVAQAAKSESRVGQLTLALARPTLDGIQASLGVISAIGGPVRNGRGGLLERYLQAEVNPMPGFSGGPLVDAEGTVLGINTSGLAGGMLLTIPVSTAWAVADILAKHGRIKRGYLGIRSQPVKLSTSSNPLGRGQETGLLLVGLEEDGPAVKAGLMVGDILVGINQHPVTDPDDLWMQLSGEVVGRSIPLEILRAGQNKTIMVTITERK